MGLVVVRCPACRGASQVGTDALGLTVRCPRCDDTFVAVEEAVLVTPARPARIERNPTLPQPRTRRKPRPKPEPVTEPIDDGQLPSEPDHDPHRHPPTGGVPASVLIGLALLPFIIPILWLIAPAVLGYNPTLSVAVPTALAVSTSILCLAVIYTIDWSPALRIKGVLMLVGLAYFTGFSLYFLKKEMVERVKHFLGPTEFWLPFQPKNGNYRVRMPGAPGPSQRDQPIPPIPLECHRLVHQDEGPFTFVVGCSKVLKKVANGPEPGTKPWFDHIIKELVAESKGEPLDPKEIAYELPENGTWPGRELKIALGNGEARFVRVYFIKDQVYYLAIEGPNLTREEVVVVNFFKSFTIVTEENRHKR